MHAHLPDDYNYPKVLARKELDYHLSKLQDVNFKNRAKSTDLFNTDKVVYDVMDHIKAKEPAPRKKNQMELGIHDKPFQPSRTKRSGIVDKGIGKFPEYKVNPLKFTTR